MVHDDGERQPLLSWSSDDEATSNTLDDRTESSPIRKLLAAIASSWSVYRLVLILFVALTVYYGTVAPAIEVYREFGCARYYEEHPEQIGLLKDHEHPCSINGIEKSNARILMLADIISGITSLSSMLFYGKRLSTWGRKPLLLIGLTPFLFQSLVLVALPRSFPFGPPPSEALISPRYCIYLLYGMNAIVGLLGATTLLSCCSRLLVVDNSNSADRTQNLVLVLIATLTAVMVGPPLAAGAAWLVPITSSGIDKVLYVMYQDIIHPRSGTKIARIFAQNPPGAPIPPPPPPPGWNVKSANVTPFLLCIIGLLLAIMYVAIYVPETVNTQSSQGGTAESETLNPVNVIQPFRFLLPSRRADNTLDWRIPALFVAIFFQYGGTTSTNTYILYFGGPLEWGPSSVSLLISSAGACRLVCIFFFLPVVVYQLEKRSRRPAALRHFSLEQLRQLSKGSAADEAPVGESSFATAQSEQDIHLLQGALSLWRAQVDRRVVQISFILDVVSWTVVAIGAGLHEVVTTLIGVNLLGFGSGATPTIQSLGVVVCRDVLANADKASRVTNDGDHCDGDYATMQKHAGEVFFSILSVLECFAFLLWPALNTSLYGYSLATFPAFPFAVAAIYFAISFVVFSAIKIHQ